MSDDQKVERQDERVEDLEVRGDDARQIAGGREANPFRSGIRRGVRYGKAAASRFNGKKES